MLWHEMKEVSIFLMYRCDTYPQAFYSFIDEIKRLMVIDHYCSQV